MGKIVRMVAAASAVAMAGVLVAGCANNGQPGSTSKIWVSSPGSSAVTVIDAATKSVAASIRFSGAPSGLAVDGDALWAADRDGTKLWRIDQSNDSITDEIALPDGPAQPSKSAQPGNQSGGAVVVSNGKVIVANASAGTVTYVNASSRAVEQTVSVGTDPYAMVATGTDLWISHRDSGVVTRHSLADAALVATVNVGGSPRGLVTVGDSIWAMNQGVQEVARISTQSNAVTARVATTSLTSFGTVHADRLWVTADDKLVGIDTSTNAVADETRIGRFNFGIASVDQANVWVTDSARNVAYEMEPVRGTFGEKLTAGLAPTYIVTNAQPQAKVA